MLTTELKATYQTCNQGFKYNATNNPRRVLTKPSKACRNEGFDNEDFDYILYVNDVLGTTEGHK
jgi:dual specificity protein kinase YAK1